MGENRKGKCIEKGASMKYEIVLHSHHASNVIGIVDFDERVDEIKNLKPPHQREARLRLMRRLTPEEISALPAPVGGELEKTRDAWEAWEKAWESLEKAHGKAWEKAGEVWEKTQKEALDAWDKALKAASAHEPEMKLWHSKVCGCVFYENGRNIFTLEKK